MAALKIKMVIAVYGAGSTNILFHIRESVRIGIYIDISLTGI